MLSVGHFLSTFQPKKEEKRTKTISKAFQRLQKKSTLRLKVDVVVPYHKSVLQGSPIKSCTRHLIWSYLNLVMFSLSTTLQDYDMKVLGRGLSLLPKLKRINLKYLFEFKILLLLLYVPDPGIEFHIDMECFRIPLNTPYISRTLRKGNYNYTLTKLQNLNREL